MKKLENTNDSQSPEPSNHERLCALVLGELDVAAAAKLEAELKGSEELRAERDRIAATIGLLRGSHEGSEVLSPEAFESLERAAARADMSPAATHPARTPWYASTPVKLAAGIAALVGGIVGGQTLMEGNEMRAPHTLNRTTPATEQLARLKRESKSAESQPAEDKELAEITQEIEQLAEESEPQSVPAGALKGPGAPPSPTNPTDSDSLGRRAQEQQQVSDKGVNLVQGMAGTDLYGYDGDPLVIEKFQGQPEAGGVPENPLLGESLTSATALKDKLATLESFKSGKLPKAGGLGPASPAKPGGPGARRFGGRALASPSEGSPVLTESLGVQFYFEEQDVYDGLDSKTGSDDFFLGVGRDTRESARRELTPDQVDELCDLRTKRILEHCCRQQGERPRDMFFRFWGANSYVLARLDNQSTFGVDVDTASYALARRYLKGGNLPGKAQIRTEEFVNYFKPDLAPPTEGVFAIHTEMAPSRFGNTGDAPSQRWMLRVGVRGKEVVAEERKPLALTFVVDTSGSMKEGQRLELVKHSLRLLVGQMHSSDSIAIVGFNNSASVILPMTSAQGRGVIEAAIYGLHPNGGTNAEGGLRLGYEVAGAGLTPGAHNRVVLLSDGVANIGQTDQDRINGDVKRHRDSGIYLNTIGVGMNNHNDTFLEQLANKGDGICNYVDSAVEARRALVENFTGAFEPIARDVKIQVEFDQNQVYRYRLLGYENRAIADADFRNDAVDAGEVGAGHQVVALYELELTGEQTSEPLATVRLRWKDPTGPGRDPLEDGASEVEQPVIFKTATTWEGAPAGYRRSAIVAQFAEILRRSVHARSDSLDELVSETSNLVAQTEDAELVEFLSLLRTSRELILQHTPQYNDLAHCIDSIRRNRILKAQYEDLRRSENVAVLTELERANEELEQRIEELIRRQVQEELK
jgi:Ca-activated chloride channel family protein